MSGLAKYIFLHRNNVLNREKSFCSRTQFALWWACLMDTCLRKVSYSTRDAFDLAFIPSMMTSSNGNTFRVTGPLWGEFTGPGEFPTQRPVTRSFDVFFDLRLIKRLSKQTWGWWFETPSWPFWRHCNASWWSKYNRLNDFCVAHSARPYKIAGDICLSNIFNEKLIDKFPVVRHARNTKWTILKALSMPSDVTCFKLRL